ncbi:unnamed protein product, partial [Choristocarpus tenellus]
VCCLFTTSRLTMFECTSGSGKSTTRFLLEHGAMDFPYQELHFLVALRCMILEICTMWKRSHVRERDIGAHIVLCSCIYIFQLFLGCAHKSKTIHSAFGQRVDCDNP